MRTIFSVALLAALTQAHYTSFNFDNYKSGQLANGLDTGLGRSAGVSYESQRLQKVLKGESRPSYAKTRSSFNNRNSNSSGPVKTGNWNSSSSVSTPTYSKRNTNSNSNTQSNSNWNQNSNTSKSNPYNNSGSTSNSNTQSNSNWNSNSNTSKSNPYSNSGSTSNSNTQSNSNWNKPSSNSSNSNWSSNGGLNTHNNSNPYSHNHSSNSNSNSSSNNNWGSNSGSTSNSNSDPFNIHGQKSTSTSNPYNNQATSNSNWGTSSSNQHPANWDVNSVWNSNSNQNNHQFLPHTHPSSPYDTPVVPQPVQPVEPAAEPEQMGSGIIRENPWVQCKHEIAQTQNELHKVSKQCPTVAELTANTSTQLAYDVQVMAAKTQQELNTAELLVVTTFNSDQDGTIGGFVSAVINLFNRQKDALQVCEMADYELGLIELTGTEIEMKLDAMVKLQEKLIEDDIAASGTIGIQAVEEDGTWATAFKDIGVLETNVNGLANTIAILSMSASAANAETMRQAGLVQDIKDEIDKQKIESDYFSVNDMPITIGTSTFQVPNSCFSVAGNEIFEFFLAATTDGGADPMNDVIAINLITGVTTLASATYFDELGPNMLSRSWSLFYKGQNLAVVPTDYSIQIMTMGGTTGTIAANNLMWGYRVYTENYPLQASAPTC